MKKILLLMLFTLFLIGCAEVDHTLMTVGQKFREETCKQDRDYRVLARKEAWEKLQIDTSYMCTELTPEEKAALLETIKARP